MLELRVSAHQRLEILVLADHDFAADDGLDAIGGPSRPRQDSLASEAQCDDLPPPGGIGLELAQDARADEHHFVALSPRLAEGPAGIDLNEFVRNLIENIGEVRVETSRNQRFPQ